MTKYYNPENNNDEFLHGAPPVGADVTEAPGPEEPAEEPRRRRSQRAAAKEQREKKRGAKDVAAPAKRLVADSRWLLFGGVLLLLVAAYLLVALLSTLVTAESDQAVIVYNSVGQIVSTGGKVANSAGPTGAWLGNALLTGSLGLGSFVLVFWLAAIGLSLLGVVKIRFWALTLKCLILAISMSVVIGLLTYATSMSIRLGGHHGYYVNKLLIDYASPFGAICFSIALCALVGVIFMTQIVRAYNKVRARMDAFKAQQEARRLAAEEAARKKAEALGAMEPLAEEKPAEEPAAEEEPEAPVEEEVDPMEFTGRFDEYAAEGEDMGGDDAVAPDADEPTDEEFKIETGVIEEADRIVTDTYDPTAELSRYHFPSIDLLEDRQGSSVTVDTEEQEANKQRIIEALAQFDIKIQSIRATVGPTITLFEVVPAPGQRIAAIKRVEEDLALALKAKGIRIIAPIPGKGTIGIEVPNNDPQVVSMRSIIASKKFQECKYELPMALGATISNDVFIADLAKMPHLLVAGATGQGKSVGLNAIITSLLYKKHPAELKFVLVDPKMVEFSLYKVLERHYLAKLPDEEDAVITDMVKVVATLNSLCVLMDRRYSLLSQAGCRGVKEYNQKFIARRLNPEKGHEYMPYIVVIVDEFADLIMTAGKEVEAPICRLAQKARAVGIHVIIATQRPSTNVITGLIKANFPGRIAFRVAQMVDSKTILDRTGAHQLVGRGDMFFSTNGNLERVQCALVDTPEVEAICESISEQQGYPHAYELPEYVPDVAGDGGGVAYSGGGGGGGDRDPLFEESARFLVSAGSTASTSSLQRRYSIGYNRAGKIMDQLEAAGIVGPAIGSKPRQVLVDPMDLDRIFG